MFTGLAGWFNKQIWHVKRVSNFARSLHVRPSTERPDHRCTYQVRQIKISFPGLCVIKQILIIAIMLQCFYSNLTLSVLQTFWPVLWVPHIAHSKEVLPSSHRNGSSVSRESYRRGAKERGQEWSQKRCTVHDNQIFKESGFSCTRARGDGEEFRDF